MVIHKIAAEKYKKQLLTLELYIKNDVCSRHSRLFGSKYTRNAFTAEERVGWLQRSYFC